ncbi:MAG: hypothetical protein FD160_2359 [Caulobacteraceae bacterium]|nr:MAG: hypothetical protein FD160_2359 [Caulobacteraceae bacterium]
MKNAAALAALLAMTGVAHAQSPPGPEAPGPGGGGESPAVPTSPQEAGAPTAVDGRVTYQPDFFAQYTPQTALDMVRRVPGFSIDSGSDRRGFSGTAGNVLIDGGRPSAKSQGLQDILGRIPAKQVVRLELIRGAASGEAAGQSVLVNVVRTASAGSGRYEAEAEISDSQRISPRGELSYNGRIGQMEFTLGADRYMEQRPLGGIRMLRDGQDNLVGARSDWTPRTYREANVNGAISTPLFGGTFNFNVSGGRENFKTALESQGFTVAPVSSVVSPAGPTVVAVPADSFRLSIDDRNRERELSADWERRFGDLTFKLVALDTREWGGNDESTRVRDNAGATAAVVSQRTRYESSESIARVSASWAVAPSHRIEFGGEGALNTLDAALSLTEDLGAGPSPIALPAANVTVEEERFEGFLTYNWKVSPRWTVESGVTVETSTISQSGDTTASRTLTYWKPNVQVSRQIGTRDQARVRLFRDVSQLDFGDFVSSATLADNTVAAGNPDLRPQATWRLEGVFDKRFGENGAVALTVAREWIEDASDLVPILDPRPGAPIPIYFDAPGNIGEGEVFSIRLTGTIPLGAVLKGGQVKVDLNWSDAEVTDPVTHRTRQISGFADTEANIEFRQDITAMKLAWGFEFYKRAEVQFFRVGELETYEEGPLMFGFVESTAIRGVKMRAFVENMLDSEFKRERRFYSPDRNGAVFRDEERERQFGRVFGVEVSGNF